MSTTKRSCEPCMEIRIKLSGAFAKDIKNVAARRGISKVAYAGPVIDQILATFPDYMKVPIPVEERVEEIRVRGKGKKVKAEIQNIADYIGVEVNTFVKVMMSLSILQLPAHMRSHPIE